MDGWAKTSMEIGNSPKSFYFLGILFKHTNNQYIINNSLLIFYRFVISIKAFIKGLSLPMNTLTKILTSLGI